MQHPVKWSKVESDVAPYRRLFRPHPQVVEEAEAQVAAQVPKAEVAAQVPKAQTDPTSQMEQTRRPWIYPWIY